MLPPLTRYDLPPEPVPAALLWRVLVLTGTDHRFEQVRAAVARLQGELQVERADTVVDALLRSARRPAELLLLDIAVDDAFAPIVVRHLARVAPLPRCCCSTIWPGPCPGTRPCRTGKPWMRVCSAGGKPVRHRGATPTRPRPP